MPRFKKVAILRFKVNFMGFKVNIMTFEVIVASESYNYFILFFSSAPQKINSHKDLLDNHRPSSWSRELLCREPGGAGGGG